MHPITRGWHHKPVKLLAAGLAMATMTSVHTLKVNTIDGKTAELSAYQGKVLLIVNVASKCGFTPQYEGLEALYRKYKGQGLVVLGFPSNDFLWQEPGSNEEIAAFCKRTYGVSFPMFAKISVKGSSQHPLYTYLTSQKGAVTWNFNKFLVGKDGHVIERYGSTVKPDDRDLVTAIEKALTRVGYDGSSTHAP